MVVAAGGVPGRGGAAWWAGRARVVNVYGPPRRRCCDGMVRGAETPAGRGAVGRPVANTRVFVLDPWLAPVPAGVTGELYVAGRGLAGATWAGRG